MKIRLNWSGEEYRVDTSVRYDLAIPLQNGEDRQPNAYGAPLYEATPVISGNFVGALSAGAPVNFYNIALNPHGNGTHTECVGHILEGPYSIRTALQNTLCVAELITVDPTNNPRGKSITLNALQSATKHHTTALIIRTLPNDGEKRYRKYTGSNPPWIEPDAMAWIASRDYQHLLVDLPSVDPEEDGGLLSAHKIFWNAEGEVRSTCTITELIFADESVPDGLYLLDLHTAALELDVSPSRPILYVMEKIG